MIFRCADKSIDLAYRTHIMGVVNCTPDSFYEKSRALRPDEAVAAGLKMVEEGADFLDVGGESSRPGADPVSIEEELDRVLPVIEALAAATTIPLSVDTTKAKVADAALAAGAAIVNDISALKFDSEMTRVLVQRNAAVVLMHIKGEPKNMQADPSYIDVVAEVTQHLMDRAAFATQHGLAPDRIILDPGIGFGKRRDDNYRLIHRLQELAKTGFPVLVGLSRKSFLSRVLSLPAAECLEGTVASNTIAILNGANILRVHDVQAAKRAAQITDHYLACSKED